MLVDKLSLSTFTSPTSVRIAVTKRYLARRSKRQRAILAAAALDGGIDLVPSTERLAAVCLHPTPTNAAILAMIRRAGPERVWQCLLAARSLRARKSAA
jgi:hypothetical protein